MGKATKLSRRSSSQSVAANKSKMNIPITQITTRAKRKRYQKTEGRIKKLFRQLRRESKGQTSPHSIIILDDSITFRPNISTADVHGPLSDTVEVGNITDAGVNVRNNEPQCTIVIKDDEPITTPQKNVYSLYHSTPIRHKSSHDDILSAGNLVDNDRNNNSTKEINASSFLTIDLTTDSANRSSQPTVIDLDNDQQDCILTSVSQGSSMSGDSDVTVLRRPARSKSFTRHMQAGLANLNQKDKNKILAFISKNLFNGCSIPTMIEPRAPETAEGTYIKEVILGKKLSRNSIGSNVYNPEKYVNTTGLRMVVVDGSNVAMAHGGHRVFSVRGLSIVIDYFLSRGHAVKAFVPRFRNKNGKSSDPQHLIRMERQGHVIFTPSREIQGRDITSYDDRYIIQCAAEFEGVIISNDGFKDLIHENPCWAQVINNRVLQYNWVNGMIMFPRDPLGRNGPTLEQFLRMPPENASRRKRN